MQRLNRYLKNQRGDTIVEVLISITVISLILGGAYVTTNKSLLATRTAQERSNALKLAESQVEQLKGAIANSATAATIFSSTTPFCIYATGGTLTVATPASGNCTLNTAGITTAAEPKFNLSISRTGNDFTVSNTWNNLSGTTVEQLQIDYRVYK
ncbi:MAG TPA: prepilin-type N-terminal cleavage/methylation domain-containing protein [Candidatus Saccharimonadales bacterium]|nr:prepilin-type N-terminal cleavage/methylation domain-containing protein [Candidatus Saccharimonadales bacterium]